MKKAFLFALTLLVSGCASTRTYTLLPGQSLTVVNHGFRKIEIRSEYPIRVADGSCFNTYTVDWKCDGQASDIEITDTRMTPIFSSPHSNAVTVIASQF